MAARKTALQTAEPKQPTWDADDEDMLRNLQTRRNEYLASKRLELRQYVLSSCPELDPEDEASLLGHMEFSASKFIELLQPFTELEQGE